MEHHATFCKNNIRYAKITLKKRKQLVREVLEKNQLVSKAAKKLNLKLSTAKLIVKRFKQEGTFFESKAERAKRQKNCDASLGKKIKSKRTTSVKQQLLNPMFENFQTPDNSIMNIPQMLYFQDNWAQPFPVAFTAFHGLIFYHF